VSGPVITLKIFASKALFGHAGQTSEKKQKVQNVKKNAQIFKNQL